MRLERNQRKEDVQERLGQLLFGVDLSPDELRLYRGRLMDAIARVEALEQELEIPAPENLSLPRSKMMITVGKLGWLPSEQTHRTVDVTPSHKIHSRNLAKNLKTLMALDPRSVHQSFHTVGVVVARGAEGTRWGEDKVELSRWGLDIVNKGDFPKVARLRLPPRFPTEAEMVKFRVS